MCEWKVQQLCGLSAGASLRWQVKGHLVTLDDAVAPQKGPFGPLTDDVDICDLMDDQMSVSSHFVKTYLQFIVEATIRSKTDLITVNNKLMSAAPSERHRNAIGAPGKMISFSRHRKSSRLWFDNSFIIILSWLEIDWRLFTIVQRRETFPGNI